MNLGFVVPISDCVQDLIFAQIQCEMLFILRYGYVMYLVNVILVYCSYSNMVMLCT
jgi:hypothetical protein